MQRGGMDLPRPRRPPGWLIGFIQRSDRDYPKPCRCTKETQSTQGDLVLIFQRMDTTGSGPCTGFFGSDVIPVSLWYRSLCALCASVVKNPRLSGEGPVNPVLDLGDLVALLV